jgi:hypothetical protein
MGIRAVRQPNGLIAHFSEIVDHFVFHSATVEESFEEWKRGMGTLEALEKVAGAIRDEVPWAFATQPRIGDGLDRWRDAIAVVGRIHGAAARAECEKWGQEPCEVEDPGTAFALLRARVHEEVVQRLQALARG